MTHRGNVVNVQCLLDSDFFCCNRGLLLHCMRPSAVSRILTRAGRVKATKDKPAEVP